MTLRTANNAVIETCQPFVVATPYNRPHFDLAPFGLTIRQANVIDPLRLDSEPFLTMLETLDGLTFGPEGMPMPRWVFYNGSELPGGIMGFGRTADQLSAEQRDRLRVPSAYDGLVPLSMFIAIPMVRRSAWMAHNLASINGVMPELGLRSLASITKSFGLAVYRTETLYGATQWDSVALIIHTKFGLLDLLTAYTPAHSNSMTLTYRVNLTAETLRHAYGDPTATLHRVAPDFWLDAGDVARAEELQDAIEAGARYQIVDRPRRTAERVEVPIVRLSDDPNWETG